ncbi:MAG: TRAP transporter small permease subunit [Leptospiraceae bacterium]|nr:TRAP transporter small permease subunit [Leptospiraceae bacterium]
MNAIFKIISLLDTINRSVGRFFAWLILFMIGGTFLSVFLRYVMGEDVIWLQELVIYAHGILFVITAGYTLLHDDHVRVDILYREFSPVRKALVNLVGTLILLVPWCLLLLNDTFFYVYDSWMLLEGSSMAGGLPFQYLFKTFMLSMPAFLLLQGIAQALRAYLILKDIEPPAEKT